MPLEKILNHTVRDPRSSFMNIPADEMTSLVSNIANAAIAESTHSKSSSVVKKNFQDLQKRLPFLNKQIRFKVDKQEIDLHIKAPEVNGDLPIFMEDIKDTVGLLEPLPATLQDSERATIWDLLRASFPKLTSSLSYNQIPRFVFSSPVPLNHENKGSFFPQIESEGQIAFIAWDSSGSQIAKGFREKTCDILLKNKEAFCGVALSQDNLEGIEKGAGVSAHFMTSKVTVIGILLTRPSFDAQSWWLDSGRIACDSASGFRGCNGASNLIARGPSSRSDCTHFGMLGVQGTRVSGARQDLLDRFKNDGERLNPFCLEIVPQFSSESTPVDEEKLKMAIEMQFQEKIYAQFSSKKVVNFR